MASFRTQAADVLWLLYTRMESRNKGISHARTKRVLKDFRKEEILRGKLFILGEGKP